MGCENGDPTFPRVTQSVDWSSIVLALYRSSLPSSAGVFFLDLGTVRFLLCLGPSRWMGKSIPPLQLTAMEDGADVVRGWATFDPSKCLCGTQRAALLPARSDLAGGMPFASLFLFKDLTRTPYRRLSSF